MADDVPGRKFLTGGSTNENDLTIARRKVTEARAAHAAATEKYHDTTVALAAAERHRAVIEAAVQRATSPDLRRAPTGGAE